MNLAWWKGTLTEEEMEGEHPLELEQIRNTQLQQQVEEELEDRGDRSGFMFQLRPRKRKGRLGVRQRLRMRRGGKG
jgi:hypothetical protein